MDRSKRRDAGHLRYCRAPCDVYIYAYDRTPGSEPRLMWVSEHIRPLLGRTRQAVSCPMNGVA